MSTLLEIDGDVHLAAPVPIAAHAVEDDGEDDDGEAGFEAERDVDRVQRAHDGLAEAVGADQRRDDHHGEAQHDALGEAGHDGREGGRQLDLPQQLALVAPKASPASIIGLGTEVMPR